MYPVQATGRRKTSSAKVFLSKASQKPGIITINKKTLEAYFPNAIDQVCIQMPLKTIQQEGVYDIRVDVRGGGFTGQKEAIRHGISRALIIVERDHRTPLKEQGFVKRDPRSKERHKYGLRGRRKKSPFRKR